MSMLEKFEKEFKPIIFGVLVVILDKADDSVFWAVFLGFIEFFQILIFPFHPAVSSTTTHNPQMSHIWNSPQLSMFMMEALDYAQLLHYFKGSWQMYQITFYCTVIFVLLIIIDIIYVSYSFKI